MKELIEFILSNEGLRLNAYKDQGGYWTIGIGNRFYEDGRPVRPGDKITRDYAFKIAEIVALDYLLHVKKCLVNPNRPANELNALTDYCYNVGKTGFKESLLLKTINNGSPRGEVISLWERSKITTDGVKCSDLVVRRKKELKLYFIL